MSRGIVWFRLITIPDIALAEFFIERYNGAVNFRIDDTLCRLWRWTNVDTDYGGRDDDRHMHSMQIKTAAATNNNTNITASLNEGIKRSIRSSSSLPSPSASVLIHFDEFAEPDEITYTMIERALYRRNSASSPNVSSLFAWRTLPVTILLNDLEKRTLTPRIDVNVRAWNDYLEIKGCSDILAIVRLRRATCDTMITAARMDIEWLYVCRCIELCRVVDVRWTCDETDALLWSRDAMRHFPKEIVIASRYLTTKPNTRRRSTVYDISTKCLVARISLSS